MKYSEILLANKKLRELQQAKPNIDIAVVSNVTVNQIIEILEHSCRKENIPAIVKIGDYDNAVQDAKKFSKSDVVCVFLEAANIVDGLQYRFDVMSDVERRAIFDKICFEIDHIFNYLSETKLVLFNQFSSLAFAVSNIRKSHFEIFVEQLNQYLEEKIAGSKNKNFLSIDINKVMAAVGLDEAIDYRYYYSAKAPYTAKYFQMYSEHLLPAIRALVGQSKKVLLLDCDNTLWNGILGEDGVEAIEMTPETSKGAIFCEIQHITKRLAQCGIIIGLISKNNFDDVNDIIKNDPRLILDDEEIIIKKINWENKAQNIKSAVEELNLGLDSVIFIDDSPFEVESVKEILSEVFVEQVPRDLHLFPNLVRNLSNHFFSLSQTDEDKARLKMYRETAKRNHDRKNYVSLDAYLSSLSLKIKINLNDQSSVPRISQLTQKTNQFNLTTQRYSESDINRFISDVNYDVYSCSLSDRFGDYGLIGVCIVKKMPTQIGQVDTLLLSCRALGRNVEIAFVANVVENCFKNCGLKVLNSHYIPTKKNKQVSDFYLKLGFLETDKTEERKCFHLEKKKALAVKPEYITVIND